MPADSADEKLTKQQRADMAFRYLDWLLTKNVPSGGFRLLYAITQHFNAVNQFHCFPSIETIAGSIRRHPSTVWEMLPKLEKIGAIEIDWGSQGSRHPNTYRLPAAFLEFYFGPENGRQPKPDPWSRKPGQTSVSKPGQTRVSDAPETRAQGQKNPGRPYGKPGQTRESHLATDSHKKERGSAARSADDARESASSSTSSDAPIPATDGPVARTARAALKQPLTEQEQPPPYRATSKKMGRPVNADADPAFAEVYRRGREVLGADADAVITELLAAHDGYVDAALDTLAVADEETDPRQYIEKDIEAARRTGRQ